MLSHNYMYNSQTVGWSYWHHGTNFGAMIYSFMNIIAKLKWLSNLDGYWFISLLIDFFLSIYMLHILTKTNNNKSSSTNHVIKSFSKIKNMKKTKFYLDRWSCFNYLASFFILMRCVAASILNLAQPFLYNQN